MTIFNTINQDHTFCTRFSYFPIIHFWWPFNISEYRFITHSSPYKVTLYHLVRIAHRCRQRYVHSRYQSHKCGCFYRHHIYRLFTYKQESAQTIHLVTADDFTSCKLLSCCLCKYHGPQTCEPWKVRSGGVVLLSADGCTVLKSTLSCAAV